MDGALIMDQGTRSVLSLAQSILGELDVDALLERVLGRVAKTHANHAAPPAPSCASGCGRAYSDAH